jgi:predicted negative regulator of RcsB-dependent stress response
MEWIQLHSRQAAIGAVLVVAGGLGFWLWRAAADKKTVEASRSLAEAQLAFSSGNFALAQSDLQKIVTRFGGTPAGLHARLLLAQALYEQKKIPEGLKVLDGASPGPYAASFHAIRAAGLEQQGKGAEAAEEYLRASSAARGNADKASFKAEAARAYQSANRTEEAKRLWSELAADETNAVSGEARMRLGELIAKRAG